MEGYSAISRPELETGFRIAIEREVRSALCTRGKTQEQVKGTLREFIRRAQRDPYYDPVVSAALSKHHGEEAYISFLLNSLEQSGKISLDGKTYSWIRKKTA